MSVWSSSFFLLLFSHGALTKDASFSPLALSSSSSRTPFTTSPPAPFDMVQREVFTSSEHGYHCFRKPALLCTSNGSLLAFAEGHSSATCADRDSEGVMVMKRSSDGGNIWSPLTLVISSPAGNPAPVEDAVAGKILLLFSHNMDGIYIMESSDEGRTWSSVVDITAMVTLPTWSKVAPSVPGGQQLPSGRLILGAFALKETGPGSFTIYSDDHGKTWERSSPTGDTSTEECQVAPLGIGESNVKQLIMTAKTPLGHLMAYSNDTGESWFNLSMPSSLNPQADCESSILSIPYDGVYMNTHLYTTQPQSPYRQNMTFFHSVDGGKTWKADFLLWKGPSAYSSLALDPRRFKVLCLYECGFISYTEKITLAIFSPLI